MFHRPPRRLMYGGPCRDPSAPFSRASRACIARQVPPSSIAYALPCSPDKGYQVLEEEHRWEESAMCAVAAARQAVIDEARRRRCDLLMVDDDVLLGPEVVDRLRRVQRRHGGIVFGVFWTQFQPGRATCPNVWMRHDFEFPARWLLPGGMERIERVYGGGACTLIPFEHLHPETYWPRLEVAQEPGEDRWASTRWGVRNVPLWGVNRLPIEHLYQSSLRTEEATRSAVERLWG